MKNVPLRLRAWGLGLLAAAVLTACGGGGGGGGDSAPPPASPTVTAIPDNLSITAPASAESATAVQFGNSSANPSGWKYQWDFGDGTTSAEAAPSHSFAGGGEFDVVLKVTNEGGTSREVRTKLSITNVANVRGLECSGASSTGWCWQNPRPTGNRVKAVFFLNATMGWRGGESGEIFKTTDGGTTWLRQNSGVTATIGGIKFLDANTGWATGAFGAMLRTTDGGATWSLSKGPDGDYATDFSLITVIDAKTVYVGRPASGYYGSIAATYDGGLTWSRLAAMPTAITPAGKLWSVSSNSPVVVSVASPGGQGYTNVLEANPPAGSYFFDSSSFVTSGDLRAALATRSSTLDYQTYTYKYYETFFTTQDGGATWSKVEFKNAATFTGVQRLLSISPDGTTLVALGNSGLLRSTDGGATWVAAAMPGNNDWYYSMYSLGGRDVVAYTPTGLWLSEDLGQSWLQLGAVSGTNFRGLVVESVRRVDAATLAAMDVDGAHYLSKDKGQTWTRVVAAPIGDYGRAMSMAFSDSKNGFMTDYAGKAFTTKDGGASWQPQQSTFGSATSLQFVSKTVGWLVGSDGRLYKSTDSGKSWLTASTSTAANDGAYFANENIGLLMRSYGAPWVFTKDGGKTWTEMSVPNGLATVRIGEQSWVAVGSSGSAYVSTDSGATWNAAYTGTSAQLLAVAFSDAKTVWAVGMDGVVLKSEDSGAKWTPVRVSVAGTTLRDIKFANAKVGWIVGEGGVILATQDGGKTWRPQSSGTGLPLYSVQIADTNTAWITGTSGLVLATGTGGN